MPPISHMPPGDARRPKGGCTGFRDGINYSMPWSALHLPSSPPIFRRTITKALVFYIAAAASGGILAGLPHATITSLNVKWVNSISRTLKLLVYVGVGKTALGSVCDLGQAVLAYKRGS